MKIRPVLLVILMILLSSCATAPKPKSQELAGLDRLDQEMKKAGVILLSELEQARQAYIQGDVLVYDRLAIGLGAAYLTTALLDMALGVASLNPIDVIGAGFSVLDSIFSISNSAKAVKNSAYVRLHFKKTLEVERQRGSNKRMLISYAWEEPTGKVRQKLNACGWNLQQVVGRSAILRDRNNPGGGYSVIADQVVIAVQYKENQKDLPEDDPCSKHSAELVLKDVVGILFPSAKASTPKN